MLIPGLILLAIGVGFIIWVKRRRFMRTNFAGVQEYKSFSGMLGSKALDFAIGFAGTIALLAGLGMLLLAIFGTK